ncbi:LysR family transcriptional regulator [Azohydromonas caseinilytica]|uniref:LysR family transcriptional regulator n=1 Tax=Azohydromonas caseinilytica TaxID=2728836 RepID=A0A848F8H2_9BURK|nr:LysR family transcriptional regulator [Azohydromonas caseinilytica]NML14819.1 LysR family transcriptional regulator [Azohydromonas caseinilytica]
MAQASPLDKIELQLVKVLHTVITERSVSRAALKLGSAQPAVSAQLRRLRHLVGDPLLVRAGNGMAPTPLALELLEPASELLRHAATLFGGAHARAFEPATARQSFRIAASDYLDPLFLPALVERLKTEAPGVELEIHALSSTYDYRRALARGEVELVIGNWLQPPGELHLARLFADEVVCLVAQDHPAVRSPRGWNAERYLAAEHVAPTALHPGARGVIDEFLDAQGLTRHIAVRSPYFGLAPLMVARSHLVLTTGRLFCSRYAERLAVRVVKCPVDFPPLSYYQLWHDATHASASARWLREQVRDVVRTLVAQAQQAARRRTSQPPDSQEETP